MAFLKKIAEEVNKGALSPALAETIKEFFESYIQAAKDNHYPLEGLDSLLETYVSLVNDQIKKPYAFQYYHERILKPFNYYEFGLNLFRPLINLSKSRVNGLENVDAIDAALKRGENAILFSNHQVEPDPQAINVLLHKTHPELAANMIFVAGHRVTSDPLAVPLSKGVNLLCIYSKNYIETPPELKLQKLTHNRHTMQKMAELLGQGGQCIYVAPSGGRDRPDKNGKVQPAPFDPDSIEMFRLMAQRSGKIVHFHTLALATHDLQPPPNQIKINLGERRQVHCTPIFLAFGREIDMDNCIPSDLEKVAKRKARAEFIWQQVIKDYNNL